MDVAVDIAIDAAVTVEWHDETNLPDGWDSAGLLVARNFGDAWVRERRETVLVVHWVLARREWNALVNPRHSDHTGVVAGTPGEVVWHARLSALALTAEIP